MTRRGRTRSFLRRLGRAALALSVICGLGVGTVGFPAVPPGSLGGEFPCQGHGCGCRSAEECWFGCCCLTSAQRLAWAKREGVTPPEGVVELARVEAAPAEKAACCGGQGGSCRRPAAKPRPACCGGACEAPGKKACEETALARGDGGRREAPTEPGFAPPRCRGLGHWWVAGGQPLGMPEGASAVPASVVSVPVAFGSTEYSFLTSAPPTRPG